MKFLEVPVTSLERVRNLLIELGFKFKGWGEGKSWEMTEFYGLE